MRRSALAIGLVLVVITAIAFLPPLIARRAGWGPDRHALPPPGRPVMIGEHLELNVIDVGNGTPVVLVHGLPSCATDWTSVPQKLAALGHRVIAYDRIGYGYSSRGSSTPERYTYESNARDLTALLDRLGIDRAALVGWSYGGAVVQVLARLHPERVSHLVLVAAVGPSLPRSHGDAVDTILQSRAGVAVMKWVAAVPPLSRRMMHDGMVQAFSGEDAIPPGWLEYTRAMLGLKGTLEAFVWEAQRSRPATLRPETLQIPTLILQGTDDRVIPAAVGEDLHRRLPQSQIVMVPHGSHMLPVTHPDLLAEQIHTFLEAAK